MKPLDHISFLAISARSVLKDFYLLNRDEFATVDREYLQGACGAASLLLCELYRRYDFTKQISVQQYYNHIDPCGCHCWVRLNNRYFIDITATQFGGPSLYFSEQIPFPLSTYKFSSDANGLGGVHNDAGSVC